jgi:FdrA protein
MPTGFRVLANRYYDSVFLMQVAQRISSDEGVEQAAALMATDNNKLVLSEIGFAGSEIESASPTDLILAVEAAQQEQLDQILADADAWLVRPSAEFKLPLADTFGEALSRLPNANLVAISVPGQYAYSEAKEALAAGKNVFLFSSNVTIEEEVSLKHLAHEGGQLIMGPDCGTAIVGGIGIGFANAVRRGNIGAIGVAGTGLQEFTSLVHRSGAGISHALGTGGRDLSDHVRGSATMTALDVFEADDETHVIAIVAKPAGSETLQALLPRLQSATKPIVACLLGTDPISDKSGTSLHWASTIDEAVRISVDLDGKGSTEGWFIPEDQLERLASEEREYLSDDQRYVRGLFAGGTFCYQAQVILRTHGLSVHSNAPLPSMLPIGDPQQSREHTLLDMGDETYTSTRPHPMIDATYRRQRILVESADPQLAVLLLDFVLGYSAAQDPVGDLLPAITEAQAAVQQRGGRLSIVASVCGTEQDPQDLAAQEQALRQAGIVVLPTNAQASELAAKIVLPRKANAR